MATSNLGLVGWQWAFVLGFALFSAVTTDYSGFAGVSGAFVGGLVGMYLIVRVVAHLNRRRKTTPASR